MRSRTSKIRTASAFILAILFVGFLSGCATLNPSPTATGKEQPAQTQPQPIAPAIEKMPEISDIYPSLKSQQLQKDTEQTVRIFDEAMKRVVSEYYRKWTREDLAKLHDHLKDYFTSKLDQHTHIVFATEEFDGWTNPFFYGVGIKIGIDKATENSRYERMKNIWMKYFPKIEPQNIKDPIAYQKVVELLEIVDAEYARLSRLIKERIVGKRGASLIDIIETKNSPAQNAGLTDKYKGWYIIEVDGWPTSNESLNNIVDRIRGKKDTIVALTLMSPDGKTAKNFRITRGPVSKTGLAKKMIPNTQIGYLEISSFASGDPQAYIRKIEELQQQGAKALIIDLQNNGGGDLGATLGLADAFIEPGKELLYVKGRGHMYCYQKANRPKLFHGPVVILQNEGSASASEVLAIILKEYGIADIVGTKSYGKGSVQVLRGLPSGGGIRYTIAKYYSPIEKICVDGKGIKPDYFVKDDPDTQVNEPLQEAVKILKEKLKHK